MDTKYRALRLAVDHDLATDRTPEDAVATARIFEAYLTEAAAESGEVPLPPPSWSNTPIDASRYKMWPLVGPADDDGETDGHGI